jgi:hypothetical protein
VKLVWMTRPALGVVSILALATACGSSNSSSQGSPTTRAQAPGDLSGTYASVLKRSDLPNNLELRQSSLRWRLTIANSGGVNGGPAFTITNATQGVVETSPFAVQGTRILIRHEECTAGGGQRFYDNEYAYKLTGRTLTLTVIKNQCRDHVAKTVLTSEPWQKISR